MHRHNFSWPLVHLLISFPCQFQEWPRVSYKDVSLCIVITFLDLLSIYWIHSHINFKNGPEYLMRTSACALSSLFLTSCPFIEIICTSISRMARVSYQDVSLCIVLTFLDLLSIYWIHSNVNFKDRPEYLIRKSACASSSLFLTTCPFIELISASISRMAPSII